MNDGNLEIDPTIAEANPGLAECGPKLVLKLSAMIRIARTHNVSNQAFKVQLEAFLEVLLKAMDKESEIALVTVADYLYLNGVRIKADTSILSVYHSLMAEFERRSLGGLRFHQGITAVELERFFGLFMSVGDAASLEHLSETIHEAGIAHVQTVAPAEIDADDLIYRLDEVPQAPSEAGRAKQVFWRTVSGTKRLLLHANHTGRPDLRHAKRLVQPVVENIMNHEYSIVGLTALKDHDEYTYAHCVNVSTLSVGMGHMLGFPRQTLADLGVAALIHDIGKIAIPRDVLRKPAKLTDEEWKLMRRHPLEGVKMMLRMPGLSTLALDTMRTCLEHHMNVNLTGYPSAPAGWEQGTMSRIVAIADCFDAMTAHRSYQKRPFTSFEALRHLTGRNREQFDPTVRWALIKTVGLYPPGSILVADSGHVVLSMSPNIKDPRRPNCRVLMRPDGTPQPENDPVTWDPMGPERRVVRVLRPEDFSINTAGYLSAFA